MDDFAQLIEKERARISKLREELHAKQSEITAQLLVLEKELEAITAYENVKSGKGERASRATMGTRAPRGSKKHELAALIKANPGITRADILERLGAKGDKTAEGSISNALTTMKKAGTLSLDGGKYTVV